MCRSLNLAAVALVGLLCTSSLAIAADSSSILVERDQSPIAAGPFQLNLARRFSSTVDQLKKRGAELKVSRAKERSISDELVALLKLAGAGQAYDAASPSQHTAAAVKPSAVWDPSAQHTQAAAPAPVPAKPTGSRRPATYKDSKLAGKPYYKPKSGPSAAYNSHLASPTDSPHPPPQNTHAAQPIPAPPAVTAWDATPAHTPAKGSPAKPSKSLSHGEHTLAAQPGASVAATNNEHVAKRGYKLLEEVQKRIQEEPWENLDSQLLCPLGETACPIFPRMGTYECVDTSSELENCGGCASRAQGEDCTLIKGTLGLACQTGKCNVFTCQPGYQFEPRGRDGHGDCIATNKKQSGFFGAKLM